MSGTNHSDIDRHFRIRQPNRPARKLIGARRMSLSLGLIYSLVLSLVQGVPAAFAQTGPRPGQNDPVRNYALFPSHSVATFTPVGDPGPGHVSVQGYRSDQGLQLSQAFAYDQPWDTDQFVAAAGRISLTDGREQVIYGRRVGGGSSLDVVFVAIPQGYASHTFTDLAPRLPNSADFMDIAVSDLDRVPDSAGSSHDEVVVAYASPGANNQLNVNVAVLDYTNQTGNAPAAGAVTSATASQTINPSFADCPTCGGILAVDNLLGVTTGDFDNDDLNEIALVFLQDGGTRRIAIFRYTNDGQGTRSLKEVSSITGGGRIFSGTVDVAAGDFDGKGADELLVSGAEYAPLNNEDPYVSQQVSFAVFQSDSELNLSFTGQAVFSAAVNNDNNWPDMNDLSKRTRVQISPGLFTYDPANGFDLNRRQFAAAWNTDDNDGSGALAVCAFTVSDDLKTISPLGSPLYWRPVDGLPYQHFSIAAGEYKGNTNIQTPQWSLALGSLHANGNYSLSTLAVGANGPGIVQQNELGNAYVSPAARYPVVPFDLDGKSVYLGAPVHFTLESVVNTDFVLQDAPKHTFYDNRPASPTYGRIINVSREDGFNVTLLNKSSQSFAATSKDSSTWNIGGSAAVSASNTVGAGIPDIDDANVTVDVSAKVGYDYNQNKESYNSNYTQNTLTQTDSTVRDDLVIGKLQLFDIWRYRVYGVAATDQQNQPTNAFYEVVLPGPTIPFDDDGLGKDWYQPVYENGNLLSYPTLQFSGDNKITPPADLGSYRVPCPSGDTSCVPCKLASDPSCNAQGTKIVSQELVAAQQVAFGGNSSSLSYEWQNTISSGTSFGYSHKLAESAEVKVGLEATIDTGVSNVKTKDSIDFEFHNTNTWGKSETSDNSTTSNTGITLNRVAGDPSQGYSFYPTFYIAQDGTVKVTHLADILSDDSASIFWKGMYGRHADPALNLPRRFTYGAVVGISGWLPNALYSRKQMRGFFVRKAEPNPVTNTYDLLASHPLAGQKVRVEARVYNYSTSAEHPVNNLKVRFQVIGYDDDSVSEVPLTSCPGGAAPQSGRCTIGETVITQMNPLAMTTAFINWDTTGFGPAQPAASSGYRVYVVLDPDNTIDETYETENPDTQYPCTDFNGNACNPALPKGVDPGQNNEGFGYITVQHPSIGAEPGAAIGADVSMQNRALGLMEENGRLRFNRALAEVNRPVMLRATVRSDKTHNRLSHLLVYDGDPDNGGRTIAAKIIHSGNKRGAHVWFDWTPTSLGRHTLYAKVVEKSHDSNPGNNTAKLEVRVVAADTTPPALQITLTPNRLWPPDGRMVPVSANIFVKDDLDRRPLVRLESITHNEANDASGDVEDAEFGTDDRQFAVRAALGGRNARRERVYEVVYSATDWAGNKALARAYVVVPRQVRR